MIGTCPRSDAEVAFKEILYGVSYYHEYQPVERLEEDVRLMQEAGVNVVRLAESSWGGFEPEEGRFEFAWMDRIVDRLHKAGIRVIVGTPTYSIPPWLWKRHPEILIEYADGKKAAYGIRQNVDLTQSAFLFYAERIIRKVAEHYAPHPAVIGFQVDNETTTRGANNRSFQVGFASRLKKKFGTVEALNKTWGLNYWGMALSNWDELPPREGVTNTGYKLEWERYKMSVIADFLTWQTRIVNEYKRPGQFVTHCFMAIPEIDLAASSREMDVLAVNKYTPAQDRCTGMDLTQTADYVRSVKRRNFLVTETTAQTTGWDCKNQEPPYDGQLRLNAYAFIGSGANMVSYWHWHSIHYGQETYWKGILSHDLEPGRVYAEFKRTASELKAIGSHLVNLQIRPKVAILLSYDSNQAIDIMPYREGKDPYWNDVVPSLYRALYDNSIAADFILPGTNSLAEYKLVIVPPLYVASDSMLKEIEAYVKVGGHVVMMFKSGFTDENSTVRHEMAPGPLRQLCGFQYQEFASIKPMPLKGNPFKVNEKENRVYDWAEFIVPHTAEAIAFYEHPFYGKYPAITRNAFGKGSLLYEGCRPSDAIQEKILMEEIERAGLKDSTRQTHFPVITKIGINALGKTVRFIYNFSGQAVVCQCDGFSGTDLLSQHFITKGDRLTLAPWDLSVIEESSKAGSEQ